MTLLLLNYCYCLVLLFCEQYLTNLCTVGFLCIFSPTAAVFSLRGLHCIEEFSSRSQTWFTKGWRNKQQTRRTKDSTKLSVTYGQTGELYLLDFLLFLFLIQHPHLIWGQAPLRHLPVFFQYGSGVKREKEIKRDKARSYCSLNAHHWAFGHKSLNHSSHHVFFLSGNSVSPLDSLCLWKRNLCNLFLSDNLHILKLFVCFLIASLVSDSTMRTSRVFTLPVNFITGIVSSPAPVST